jgi:hypothetical protein
VTWVRGRVVSLLLALGLAGCFFDHTGVPATQPGPTTDGKQLAELGTADLRQWDRGLQPADLTPTEPGPKPDGPPTDTWFPIPDLPLCQGLTCPLGCNQALKRCNRLKPSNFDATSLYDLSQADLSQGGDLELNTDSGEVRQGGNVVRAGGNAGTEKNGIYWGVVPQPGYPEVSVFGVAKLSVQGGEKLVVNGARALALYATGDVSLAGSVTSIPDGTAAGAGGYNGGSGASDGASCQGGEGGKGESWSSRDSGGGGGGHKAKGGDGGDSDGSIPPRDGGTGGTPVGTDTLVPLRGGCGGGGGGDGGAGGGGGGALQISANGTIAVSGTINMPGGPGKGHTSAGGGGGGAGGAILLEGAAVTVTGTLAANGGGGGGYSDGQPGQPSAVNANGGGGAANNAAGGKGGALNPESGGTGGVDYWNGGGGGGGAGRIRLNALQITTSGAKAISPAASTSPTVSTW